MKKKILLFSSVCLFPILIGASLTSCAQKYKVTINSVYLDLVGDLTASTNSNYTCSFKIKDDALPLRYMDNIDIDTMSVKVEGVEIDKNNFSFIYQTNAKNEFTIQQSAINGDIEISVDMVKRSQKQNCFFFEFDLDDYVDFKDIKISYPDSSKQKDKSGVDDKLTKSKDDIYLKSGCDVAIIPKSDPFSLFGDSYNLLVLREDNAIKFDIKAKDGVTLPKNIWFRSNARFTKKNEDFTITYSEDYKSATIEVPYFFIRDNGSFRLNPDVEA